MGTDVAAQVIPPTLFQLGQFKSGNFVLPATISLVRLTANLLLADKLADGLTFDVHVQISADGGVTFPTDVGFGWTSYGPGGYSYFDKATQQTIVNPDPFLEFDPSAYAGQTARVLLNVQTPLTIGATVNVTS